MLKSKTLWASVTAITGALGSWQMGELAFAEMLQITVTAALAVFLRHGVSKVDKKIDQVT
jgi:hypothetical protein